jgi:cytochrome c-type biogenesis protein CcmH
VTTVAAPAVGSSRSLRKWLPLVALVAVAVVALVIGTRPHHKPATLEQRTMSIAGLVRCPVCSGETAAQSDTLQSIQVQQQIHQDLQAGQSRSQILSELEASYGSSILEKPPVKGANVLLWFLPGIAVLIAIAGLILVFRRWRLARVAGASDEDVRLVGGALGRSGPDPDDGGEP